MVKQPDIKIDLSELNQSELVMLCHWADIKEASRGWPRELLIQALQNFETYPDLKTGIDVKRGKMKAWLKLHWDRMEMQADKKVCPNCEKCRDLQVSECFRHNRRKIEGVP